MSDTQTAWAMIWDRAGKAGGPIEIGEIAPALADQLGVTEKEANRLIALVLGEVVRLPDGREFFCLEGQAIVPLPEFNAAYAAGESAQQAYPFEL